MRNVDSKTLLIVIAMVVLAIAFWDSPLIFPIKAFVVLLHELSHGLAAVVTGGHIERIELSANLGGVCWSRGGLRAAVLPAGYLGSMLWGGVILVGAARSRHDKVFSAIIGVVVLVTTVMFVRTVFGIAFGLLFGGGLIAVALVFSPWVNDVLLKLLGVTCSLYAVIDIKQDLISRTIPGSDAYVMSEEFFFPPVFWGVFWIVIALAFTMLFLWLSIRGPNPSVDPEPKATHFKRS